MLKEIYCEKFKTFNNTPRGKIKLKTGLNIVEGDDNGSNSIGKSTFLMCVDFAFGGNDYTEKLNDVITNDGHHEICFAFEFDKTYYFCRKTDEPKFIYICDENYNKTDVKKDVGDFTKFLKEKYGIQISYLTFRQIVSRFFRVYNRENLNESLPLKSHDDESEKSSIDELIKLFNMYGLIETADKRNKLVAEKKEAFKAALKHKFIPSITDPEYKNNLKKIDELTKQAEDLVERSEKGLIDVDAEKAERIGQLKEQLTYLRRTRGRYYTQLNAYKRDAEFEVSNLQTDFSDLSDFFDNINIQKLSELENFHKGIKSILHMEFTNAINETWKNINMLTESITELEKSLSELSTTKNVSKIVMQSYAAMLRQKDELERINQYHIEKDTIDAEAKETQAELDKVTTEQLDILQARLNAKMSELNEQYYGNETNAPLLVAKPKTYKFYTPDDQGTGCRYKGVLTLDLAILSLTDLPALIHDSVMYSQLSYKRVEYTMRLYQTFTKQIFIAVDKTTNLNEETKQIISDNRILFLSPNGNELFGRYWGKPKGVK